jgi:hypothetical protein
MRITGPSEHLWEQRFNGASLRLGGTIRFIPEVPSQHPIIVAASEGRDNALNIRLQASKLTPVCYGLRPWRLDPPRIVHTRNGWMLGSEFRIRVPAAVKKDEDRPDVVSVGNR